MLSQANEGHGRPRSQKSQLPGLYTVETPSRFSIC